MSEGHTKHDCTRPVVCRQCKKEGHFRDDQDCEAVLEQRQSPSTYTATAATPTISLLLPHPPSYPKLNFPWRNFPLHSVAYRIVVAPDGRFNDHSVRKTTIQCVRKQPSSVTTIRYAIQTPKHPGWSSHWMVVITITRVEHRLCAYQN